MPPTFLLKNIVLFGRLLRSVGLDVGSSQVIDLAAGAGGKLADFQGDSGGDAHDRYRNPHRRK